MVPRSRTSGRSARKNSVVSQKTRASQAFSPRMARYTPCYNTGRTPKVPQALARCTYDVLGPDNHTTAQTERVTAFPRLSRAGRLTRALFCKPLTGPRLQALLQGVPCGRRGEWCPCDRHLRARTRLW